MARKTEYPKISQVLFCYLGTDESFNRFLKSVVHDYLSNELDDLEDKVQENNDENLYSI